MRFSPHWETNGRAIAGITDVTGNSSTSFNTPCSLALDSQLNLYVADTDNNRVQAFVRY
jgi:NHL repeat